MRLQPDCVGKRRDINSASSNVAPICANSWPPSESAIFVEQCIDRRAHPRDGQALV